MVATGPPARYRGRAQARDTWAVVVLLLAGALTTAVGVMLDALPLLVAGPVMVLTGLVLAMALSRAGVTAPISLGAQVPPWDGRRGAGPKRLPRAVRRPRRELPAGAETRHRIPLFEDTGPAWSVTVETDPPESESATGREGTG